MEPEVLAGLSLGGTLLGGGVSAAATKQQAKAAQDAISFQQLGLQGQAESLAAERESSLYQQSIALRNKEMADKYAQAEIEKGIVEEQAQRMRAAQAFGSTVAAQGASGIDVASGSSQDVRRSMKMLSELDAETIRSNAAKAAFGFRERGVGFSEEARLMGMRADSAGRGIARVGEGVGYLDRAKRSAGKSGDLGLISSLLGTGTSVADKWMKFKGAGVF